MRSKSTVLLLAVVLAAAGCKSESPAPVASAPTAAPAVKAEATAVAETPTAGDGWLDNELTNWNAPGQEIPRPKAMDVDDATKERCNAQNRPVSSPEDNALAAAGWKLFGPLQTFGTATMISAMATVDAGCRPVGMQTFVFREGKFAGTVSPTAMDSQRDGAQRYAFLVGDAYFTVQFARYAKGDRACCPSRFATVAYKIKTEPQGPVLVPLTVAHEDAPPPPKS